MKNKEEKAKYIILSLPNIPIFYSIEQNVNLSFIYHLSLLILSFWLSVLILLHTQDGANTIQYMDQVLDFLDKRWTVTLIP